LSYMEVCLDYCQEVCLDYCHIWKSVFPYMEVGLDYCHIWKWVVAQAQNKSENFFNQSGVRKIRCFTLSRLKQKR
jgi:hypothetical protein